MDITKYVKKGSIAVKVIPHAAANKIVEENEGLKVYLTAIPDKNKANAALVKFFKRELNLQIRIIKGSKSREKVLEVVLSADIIRKKQPQDLYNNSL